MTPTRSLLALALTLTAMQSAAGATAAPEDDTCSNAAIRTQQHSRGLPDCRAYEQVSPPDKNDNDVGGLTDPLTKPQALASADGQALTFETIGSLPGSQAATTINQNLSRRGPAGWATEPITPPQAPRRDAAFPSFQFFTPDLAQAIVSAPLSPPLAAGAVPGVANLYIRDNHSGRYTTLSVNPPANLDGQGFSFAGASSDLKHVIFESQEALTPDAPVVPFLTNLYEWTGGQLRLVTILPDGTPAPNGGGAGHVAGASAGTYSLNHVISADGSRIVFGVGDGDGGRIYLREDGVRTVEVTRSHRAGSDPPGAKFWGASPDLSKIYFSSGAALTNDAPANSSNLYRYDTDTDTLTDITANPLGSGQSQFLGVEAMSQDGSYVYFRDRSVYIPGKGEEGAWNLYLLHGDTLRFITADNVPVLATNFFDRDKDTSRVTPDGRYLVFTSTRSLTGYDNVDAVTGQPDSEVFLYDAVSDTLRCTSCRPDGTRPAGSAALLPVPTRNLLNPPKSVTDDGHRVFFNTVDALVPADVNGKLDAYMYEDGAVHILSSGSDSNDSYFVGASSDGDDAFFVTRARLTSTDKDSNLDVYDARVDGGLPDPPSIVPCSGDGCFPAPTPDPTLPTAISRFVLGDGNAAPTGSPAVAFRLAAISRTGRRTAARTGVLRLSVRVSKGGVLKGRVSASLNGRRKLVGSGVTHVSRAGTAQLRLPLAKAVRKKLARGKTVKVSVRVRFSHASHAKNLTLELNR
jgi:WD40-like Beta Propeller Repeat